MLASEVNMMGKKKEKLLKMMCAIPNLKIRNYAQLSLYFMPKDKMCRALRVQSSAWGK
jgi:hypothetical protein